MMPFVEIAAEQRSPEWFAARAGRLTGSVAGDMLARTKTGWGASRRNLLLKLVLERLTGIPEQSGFVSPAMQAGIDREPLARAAFEALTGEIVQTSGFLQARDVMAGCSLDGHLGDYEALVSIKCRQPAAHLEYLKTGVIPFEAMCQMEHEMWITGASYHHYVCFNPDFPPGLQLKFRSVKPHEFDIPRYAEQARAFLAEVEAECAAVRSLVKEA